LCKESISSLLFQVLQIRLIEVVEADGDVTMREAEEVKISDSNGN